MVRRSKPGQNNKISKPQLKPKQLSSEEPPTLPTIDDCFPLAKDPIYNSLSSAKQKFVYLYYLKPITGLANYQIYKQIRPLVTVASAQILSGKWLKDPNICHCLSALQKEHNERLGYTAERLQTELASLAFSDIANYLNEDGYLTTNPHELPPSARAAISSFETTQDKYGDVIYKIRQWSKPEAIKQLVKMQGLEAPKKHEFSGPGGGPINMSVTKKVDLSHLDNDELDLLCKIVEKNQSNEVDKIQKELS